MANVGKDADRVWVTVSYTINTGNYESIKIDAGYSEAYTSDEEPAEKIDEMINELRGVLKQQKRMIKSKLK